jgi:16S rRNA C1402 (ribose-2'-O) methylase RsmI
VRQLLGGLVVELVGAVALGQHGVAHLGGAGELGPARVVCVGRELTKLHETIRTAPLAELVPALKSGSLKGEFTVAIAPADFVL